VLSATGKIIGTINWLFIGKGRALFLFALSLLIILTWAYLEKINSWLDSIWARAFVLLAIFILVIFLAKLIELVVPRLLSRHESSKHERAYYLEVILVFFVLACLYLLPKGFLSSTPLFWLIAFLIVWSFLMILSWPVLLPIGSDTWDLANLRLLSFAKGPIGLLGRFRSSQGYVFVGPIKNFLIATFIILLFTYKSTEAVTKGMPLKNLTQWALNGTTWLGGAAVSGLINGTKIMKDSNQAGGLPINKTLDSINISGGEIRNITLDNTLIQGQTIVNATSKMPINLSNNETYSNIIINKSIFADNLISNADIVFKNLSNANESVIKILSHSPVDLIQRNVNGANATIYNITLKNITLLNATISSFLNNTLRDISILNTTWAANGNSAYGNLIGLKATINATIDMNEASNIIVDNITLKNATILDASFYKTTLENISLLNSSIAGALLPPGSSGAAAQSTSLLHDLLISFAGMMDNILSNIWTNLPQILFLWALLEILTIAWAAHKRIVIQDFDDNTTEKNKGKLAAMQLAMKISDLNAIYSKANEMGAVSTSTGMDQPLQAGITITDLSENLFANLKTDKKIPAGNWFEIPANLLISLMDSIVRGPKLAGSIYKGTDKENKEILILSAHVLGGGLPNRSWQVQKKLSTTSKSQEIVASVGKNHSDVTAATQLQTTQDQSGLGQGTPDFDEAIDELACRIFTDLVFNPSQRDLVRWKATMKFREGLRAYRSCLRSRMDKKLKLMEAERNFLGTLAEDEKFNMVYYNLGVVYNELGRQDAANAAFLKSTEKSPNQWEAYYALGMNLFNEIQNPNKTFEELKSKMHYKEVISLCDHAISLRPKPFEQEAKVYDLKGLAQRFHEMPSAKEIGDVAPEVAAAIESHKRAVSLGYRALYNAKLNGIETEEIILILTNCLFNLATDYYYHHFYDDNSQNKVLRSIILLDEARSLLPSSSQLHIRLGQIYCGHYMTDKAVEEFEKARGIDPASTEILSTLALGYATAAAVLQKTDQDEEGNTESMSVNENQEKSLDTTKIAKEPDIIDNKSKAKYFCKKVLCSPILPSHEDIDRVKRSCKKLKMEDQKICTNYLINKKIIEGYDEEQLLEAVKEGSNTALERAQAAIQLRSLYLKHNTREAEDAKSFCEKAIHDLLETIPDLLENEILANIWRNCNKAMVELRKILNSPKESVSEAYKICNDSKKLMEENPDCTQNGGKSLQDDLRLAKNAIYLIILANGKDEQIIKESALEAIKNLEYIEEIIERLDCIYYNRYADICQTLGELYLNVDQGKNQECKYSSENKAVTGANENRDLEEPPQKKNSPNKCTAEKSDKEKEMDGSKGSKLAECSEEYFRKAIKALERECPKKITQLELRSDLARALMRQETKGFEAQTEVERAICSDPLDYRERFELGLANANINCLDEAKTAWETALHLNPDDPRIRYNIGVTYLRQYYDLAEQNRTKEKLELEKAAERLKEALELFGTDYSQLAYRMRTYYWLGVTYYEQEKFEKAIESLRISQALSKTKPPQCETLIITHCLANAYFKIKRFAEGETEFKRILTLGEELEKTEGLNSPCGIGLGKQKSLGYVMAITCFDLLIFYADHAITYVEKQDRLRQNCSGYYSQLEEGQKLADRLDEFADGLTPKEYERIKNHCLGWIAYKKGVLGYKEFAKERIQKAISHLEMSLMTSDDADTLGYVHLALAYKEMAIIVDDESRNIGENALVQVLHYALSIPAPNSSKAQGNVCQQPSIERQKNELIDQKRRLILSIQNCRKYIEDLKIKKEYEEQLNELDAYIKSQKGDTNKENTISNIVSQSPNADIAVCRSKNDPKKGVKKTE
jgi:tetratricopeptide (TPR) repeat protein